jgi:hypothetical protein
VMARSTPGSTGTTGCEVSGKEADPSGHPGGIMAIRRMGRKVLRRSVLHRIVAIGTMGHQVLRRLRRSLLHGIRAFVSKRFIVNQHRPLDPVGKVLMKRSLMRTLGTRFKDGDHGTTYHSFRPGGLRARSSSWRSLQEQQGSLWRCWRSAYGAYHR